MPRVNRLTRAAEHPDAVVGCIMTLQEKIKLLGRAIVGCRCPDYQAELQELRDNLSIMRSQYQDQRNILRRLQIRGQETLAHYQSRVRTLLQANSNQLLNRVKQEEAIRQELKSLRNHIWHLSIVLVENDLDVPAMPLVPWVVETSSSPFTWVLNETWVAKYPDGDPGPNPSNTEYRPVSVDSPSESSKTS